MRCLTHLAAVAAFAVVPLATSAGGYSGPVTCDELAAAGQLRSGVQCRRGTGVYEIDSRVGAPATGIRGYYYRLIRHVPATEVVYGKRCPYPHRPSDSVFSGGAWYIIKDTVRARIGCVY